MHPSVLFELPLTTVTILTEVYDYVRVRIQQASLVRGLAHYQIRRTFILRQTAPIAPPWPGFQLRLRGVIAKHVPATHALIIQSRIVGILRVHPNKTARLIKIAPRDIRPPNAEHINMFLPYLFISPPPKK
jgi:hypothetical protein